MSRKLVRALVTATWAVTAAQAAQGADGAEGAARAKRPNVLIFLLDDAGFAHLGAFGGTIATPNIDRVAAMGLRYTNFHTTALCSPTRAALLTGRNHHSVGSGVIAEIATSEPGYTGRIPDDKFPLVESFQTNGYRTAAFGKWHNTTLDQIGTNARHDRRPTDVGFDRFYGFLGGDTTQWETAVWDDNTFVQPQNGNQNYQFTADMTDKTIAWLREGRRSPDAPFFLYYATAAMHAPHHAPPEYIAKYKGKFDMGWDQMREAVFARQLAMGLLPKTTVLSPRTSEIKAWLDLNDEEKLLYSRFQEVFAGYLEYADAQFGRVLAELEKTGELDDTIIIVTSDNGASGEGGLEGTYNENRFFNALPEDFDLNFARIDDLGTRMTYNHYPAGWALAGNTPFKYFKQTTNEGGVRDPFIIAWPSRIKEGGALRTQFAHVNDLMPTLLEMTQVPMSKVVRGVEQKPMEGVSFAPTIADAAVPTAKKVQYFEMLGNRGLWQDGWKAVAFHGRLPWDSSSSNPNFDDDVWQLYDTVDDPSEMRDLAAAHPEKLAAMKRTFDEEARKYNVYPLDDTTSARFAITAAHLVGGRTEFTYASRDRGIPELAAAPTKNRSHEIVAELVVPEGGADGAIVVNGGRFGGYAVFVKDGHLHYAHNYVAETIYDVAATEPVPSGNVTVRVLFTKTGENKGDVTLFVDGRQVGAGEIPRTVPRAYGLCDTFDVGVDSFSPVSDLYEAPFEFQGEVKSVRIKLL